MATKNCEIHSRFAEVIVDNFRLALLHGEETELLRNIRDDVLRQTPEGREIITLFYQYSTAMAKALRKDEGLSKEAKKILDGILSLMIFLEQAVKGAS